MKSSSMTCVTRPTAVSAGQHIKRYWTGGRPYGYRLKQNLDPVERDPFGQPKRIGSQIELHPEQPRSF